MTDATRPITGGCLCGAVRYTATAPPIGVRQCWCRDCQYWGAGSSTVNAIFETASITLTGTLSTFVSQAASGNTMTRGFCGVCGTPVTSASDARPTLVILRTGTLDDPAAVTPAMNIWTGSAPQWVHLDPAIPATLAQPGPLPIIPPAITG